MSIVTFMLPPKVMAGKVHLTGVGKLLVMVGNVGGLDPRTRVIIWLIPPTLAKLPKTEMTNILVRFSLFGA